MWHKTLLNLIQVTTLALLALTASSLTGCEVYKRCDVCTDAGALAFCTSCVDPYFLFPDMPSLECKFCNQIIPDCQSCGNLAGITQCDICVTGNWLFLEADCETCSDQCPFNTMDSDGDRICDCNIGSQNLISSDGDKCVQDCNQCQYYSSISLVSGAKRCVKQCWPFYVDLLGRECIKSCGCYQIFDNSGKCICRSDAVRDGNKCVLSCGRLMHNLPQKVCVQKCGQFQVLRDGKCLCQKGLVKSSNSSECLLKCPPDEFLSIDGKACVKSCSPYFRTSTSNKCVRSEDCTQSTDTRVSNECRCDKSAFLSASNNECIPFKCNCNLSEGNFVVNGKCLRCKSPCKTCAGAGDNCKSCIIRYGLVSSAVESTKVSCMICSSKFCLRCEGKVENCIVCIPGYTLTQGKCVKTYI